MTLTKWIINFINFWFRFKWNSFDSEKDDDEDACLNQWITASKLSKAKPMQNDWVDDEIIAKLTVSK